MVCKFSDIGESSELQLRSYVFTSRERKKTRLVIEQMLFGCYNKVIIEINLFSTTLSLTINGKKHDALNFFINKL